MPWKLACFDLDGTLAMTSTGQHLAGKIGHATVMRELEEGYLAGRISNIEVAACDAVYYRNLDRDDLARMLEDIPVIADITKTVEWLQQRGVASVICTLAWRSVGEIFARRYGFIGSSGPVLRTDESGVFTGEVESDFTEHDKPSFVRELCATRGIAMSDVFHVGDSVSDIPLFRAVGFSVALNGNRQARQTADVSLNSGSLFEVVGVVPGLAGALDVGSFQ